MIILVSTRLGRIGEAVASWVLKVATSRSVDGDVFEGPHQGVGSDHCELRRLRRRHPGVQPWQYGSPQEHRRQSLSRVEQQGSQICQPLQRRWRRTVEQLRLVMGELHVADVRQQVHFPPFHDFENFSNFGLDRNMRV